MTIQLWFILDVVVFMLCKEHSEVVCRRQNGELMVYSKPYTTCLMSPLQKEKITKILLDLRLFHCLSVDTDRLKTRQLQTELFMLGLTLLGMQMKPWRSQGVKFQDHPLPHLELLYRMAWYLQGCNSFPQLQLLWCQIFRPSWPLK